ncbi:sensor histidine kinase [Ahrensia sp. 13_GOM-1096m]|uniref:sensor histidine kinase n=1 Tax=Ahrensia sp. 13_GOM-1096m TaxID=1380380 RepID=UPI0006877EA6|nr:sensor histidine kinase [Ahrensia sp. 13_GOM-1096m]
MKRNLTWHRKDYREDRFRDGLILALVHSGVCVCAQAESGEYLFVANMHKPWHFDQDTDPVDTEIFGEDLGQRLKLAKSRVLENRETEEFEVHLPDSGFYQIIIDFVASPYGAPLILTMIKDISEERHREQVLKNLLRELSHRSKNLLAIVLSLASQTAREHSDLGGFLKIFRGRIFSLSASQDLVTDMSWSGAGFHDLVENQVKKYFPEDASRIKVKGDDPVLTPNAATHVGLALHELIVNLASRDAQNEGAVSAVIDCWVLPNKAGIDETHITWRESAESGAIQPEFTNVFSEPMLQRIIPTSVSGSAEIEVDGGTVSYSLVFPSAENRHS